MSIDHPMVSRQHARLQLDAQGLWITDLGSTNGTIAAGERLQANVPRLIKTGEKVFLTPDQQVVLELQAESAPAGSGSRQAMQSIKDLLGNASSVVVGRSSDCDVTLSDAAVSRRHARLLQEQGGVYIEDLGSTNGTFVNGQKIRKKTKLSSTDTVLIGMYAFRLEEQARNLSNESAINAVNITKDYPNGYRGLQPTTIDIPYREMVALMGPSGCGKTTLLKALNGDSPPTAGQVELFGLDLFEYFGYLKQIIGYVPQEDIVHLDLTVQDSLFYAAKLRLPQATPREDILSRIDEVLSDLNINDPQIRKTAVGRLSGGQRKRVSIAVELLTRPKVLFLDEPTSPLDPETIEDFLSCLRKLCDQGTTVVMVTHKPEDLNYVDRVVFMGTKGHLVYDGPREGFLSHFSKKHIIEVYSLMSSADVSKHWYDKWFRSRSDMSQPARQVQEQSEKVRPLHQLYWLIVRYLKIKVSNTRNLILLVLQPVLIAFLILAVFDTLVEEQELAPEIFSKVGNVGIIFLMAIAAIWFGVSNSAKEIVGEMPITKRERMFNLLLWPYLLSKSLVLMLLSAFQLVVFLAILFVAYPEAGMAVESWLFLMLVSLGAIQFGLLLSAATSSTEEVMSILPIALMPQIILAGIIQPIQNQVTMVLSYFTLGRWGTEGLSRIQDAAYGTAEERPYMDVLQENLYQLDQIIVTDNARAVLIALLSLAAGMMIISRILLQKKYG